MQVHEQKPFFFAIENIETIAKTIAKPRQAHKLLHLCRKRD